MMKLIFVGFVINGINKIFNLLFKILRIEIIFGRTIMSKKFYLFIFNLINICQGL